MYTAVCDGRDTDEVGVLAVGTGEARSFALPAVFRLQLPVARPNPGRPSLGCL